MRVTHVSDVKGILLSILTRADKLGKICTCAHNTLHHLMVHDAPSVLPDILARRRSRSHRRYSISDGSTRPAPYDGFNEPIKLSLYGHHDEHRFPALPLSLSSRLIVLIYTLHELYPSLRRFYYTAPFLSVIARASLCGLNVSSCFWPRRILCIAWNYRFNNYNCHWDTSYLLDRVLDIN